MEDNENRFLQLKYQWVDFVAIVFQPTVIILVILIVILFYISSTQSNARFTATLTTIISLFSGLAGSIITKRWAEMNEGTILVTRGKSAIRSLKLLLLNISTIERRVAIYIERLDKSNEEYNLIKGNYEEIIDKCSTLQEEALNSIEDWADIVPDAKVASQVGLISELKLNQKNAEKEILELTARLDKAEKESTEKKALEKQLQEKERELSRIKQRLTQKESLLNDSILSGIITGSSSVWPSRFFGGSYELNTEIQQPFDFDITVLNPPSTKGPFSSDTDDEDDSDDEVSETEPSPN